MFGEAAKGNEISNAQDTTNERPTPKEAKCLDDIKVATYMRINRKKTSIVWQEMTVVKLADGTKKLQCNHCKIKLSKNKDGTITQYKRHLDGCVKHQASLKGQGNLFLPPQAPRSDSASGIQTWKYDQANIREVVSQMIMGHALPFAFTKYELFTLLMKIASLHHKSYEVEKKRISITTDMWKSGQKIQYMVLTGHFKCLQNWGIEGKVCLIFVGSASYNDAFIRMLKDSLSIYKRLTLNGKLCYVCCCAHILNLLVHDGLSKIEDVIDNEVCYFLALFNEVNIIISGSEYPTSNLFFPKLWSIKELLMEKSLSEELWMRQMADKMQIKFDKYWDECSLLISIVVIIDPKNKMKLIYLYELYKEYVDEYAAANVVTSMENDVIGKGKVMTRRSKFERYSRSVDKVDNESCSDFDVLEWWKINNLNAGGRVVDAYCSSLGTDTVQMLLCGSDWYWNFYGLKKKAKVSNFQVFVLFI
ncbi:hypothetical protein ES332_D12G097400v1 [Gossypium tomentosum]|uniref:hAT-like transposase RNase-H fold domain-containing protein n=1 Tax=Gossypium tomentosum TaxID=34277 RepID=A0A5D2I6L3_GOSTO|nr:hypothetical protein ES332_D12G097400v1 [Gossypium tomentosum]